MLIPAAKSMRLKPSQVNIIWEIAHELDRRRVSENVTDAVWLKIASKRMRNPKGRDDNHHLKKCLNELVGLQLEGEHKGEAWGAALIAEFHIKEGGSLVELLIPPAGVKAVLAPHTFAKIESEAKFRLDGAPKLLYAALADKKHLGRPYWTFALDDLRDTLYLRDRYPRWVDFNRYVLQPAIQKIHEFGTVKIKPTPQKEGRSIVAVRFDWEWKSLDEAMETAEKNEKHSSSRGKTSDGSASPLTDVATDDDQEAAEGHRAQVEADRAAFREWLKENPNGNFMQYIEAKEAAANG